MISVTKKFEFSYAHFLPGYIGDCANLHGHNSNVEVEFAFDKKMPLAYDGMVVDFKDIKKYIKPIIDELDHKLLNDFFDDDINPTAEYIATWIAGRIKETTSIGAGLIRVQVSETNDSFATWRPDK